MTSQKLARDVLDQWRALERRVGAAAQGSAEATLLASEAEVLRHEYQQLVAVAATHYGHMPPLFPEDEELEPTPPPDELGDGPDLSFRRALPSL